MKFFIDTADVEAIRELNETGLVDGVTTNPSLIMKSGRDIVEVTKEICDIVSGPVSAEVTATEFSGMVGEAEVLARMSRAEHGSIEGNKPANDNDWERVAKAAPDHGTGLERARR